MDEYLHILLTTLQHDIAFFLRSMTLFIVHVFFAIYMQYHSHGRHGTVENASNILEF